MAENTGGIPLIGTIASIGSGLIGGIGSYLAAQETAGAIRKAAKVERQNFTDSLAALQPQINAGNTAREFQLGALGLPGGNSDAINLWRQSPGYTAALDTGKNAVQTSAAAGGNLFSGKTLKDLASFGQGLEDQTFGQWYDRLGRLSGAGSAATGQAVNLGTSTAGNLADLAVRGGDARASSYIGGANAAIGGLQNLVDLYAYYNPPVRPLGQGGIGHA